MLNSEFEREFYFNIDEYLIREYSLMNLSTRRAVCFLALGAIDEEVLEEIVDDVVADYAIDQCKFRKPEDESDS